MPGFCSLPGSGDRARTIIHLDRKMAEAVRQCRGVDWDWVFNEAVRQKLKMLDQKPAAK
ncbi:hypothetical protein Pan44_53810 [Caulifigura coniformis]|uniref:Post-segregation antitoxin CcdA n=1 Tax=Caulifigura coniformis TaxID=2527983 RepID=A0A517SMF8_9PLAN|nr:hypothetical protein Pan44_53810 [Caulifigura coniformis]